MGSGSFKYVGDYKIKLDSSGGSCLPCVCAGACEYKMRVAFFFRRDQCRQTVLHSLWVAMHRAAVWGQGHSARRSETQIHMWNLFAGNKIAGNYGLSLLLMSCANWSSLWVLPAVRTSALIDIKFVSSVRKNKTKQTTCTHIHVYMYQFAFAQASDMYAYRQY